MGEVSFTSVSEVLEQFWNIWSQVTQRKKQLFYSSFGGSSLGLFDEDAISGARGSGTYTVS